MKVSTSLMLKSSGMFIIDGTLDSSSPKVSLFFSGYWLESGIADMVPLLSGQRNVQLTVGQDLAEFDRIWVDYKSNFPVITGLFDAETVLGEPDPEPKKASKKSRTL